MGSLVQVQSKTLMLTMKNLWSNYVLSNLKFLHLENKSQLLKVPCLLVPSSNVFFISLHIKLSSLLYGTQLVDMFAYEVGTSVSSTSQPTQSGTNLSLSSSVVVYNFHSVLNHERLFFFFVNSTSYVSGLNSISDLFQASNWLEREVDELHGISFF